MAGQLFLVRVRYTYIYQIFATGGDVFEGSHKKTPVGALGGIEDESRSVPRALQQRTERQ